MFHDRLANPLNRWISPYGLFEKQAFSDLKQIDVERSMHVMSKAGVFRSLAVFKWPKNITSIWSKNVRKHKM